MDTRRELLKRFGIGALIAPIVGGVVVPSATAELIEIPKIKPVELHTEVPKDLQIGRVVGASIVLKLSDGTTRVLDIEHPFVMGETITPGQQLSATVKIVKYHEGSSPRSEERLAWIEGDVRL